MITVLIISAIINIVVLILFVILCIHVSQIKDSTDQNVYASSYIELAFESRKYAMENTDDEWRSNALAHAKRSIRYYKIAQYYIGQNRLGKIPSFLMEKYDGTFDLVEYVNQFIQNELKSLEDLAKNPENEETKNKAG